MTTAANAFDVQPPHLRYQPKAKSRLTIHAMNVERASQSTGT